MSTSGADAPALALSAGPVTVNTATGSALLCGSGSIQTPISIHDVGTGLVVDPTGLPASIALTRGQSPTGDGWQSAEPLVAAPDGSARVYSKVDADNFAPGAYFVWVRVIVPLQGQTVGQGQELIARAGVARVQGTVLPSVLPSAVASITTASALADWPLAPGVNYLDTPDSGLSLTVRPGATGSGRSAWLKNAGTGAALLAAQDGSTFDGMPSLTLNAGDLVQITDYSEGRFAITMTSLKSSAGASPFGDAIDPPASTVNTPLAVPAPPIADYLIERKLTSGNLTDYAYSNNQGGRIIKTTYANNELSTGNWIVYAAPGETFQTTDGGAGLAYIVLQPGESRTMQNISNTVGKQV